MIKLNKHIKKAVYINKMSYTNIDKSKKIQYY